MFSYAGHRNITGCDSKGDGEGLRWGRAYQCFRQRCRLSVMCRPLHITCSTKAYFSNRSWLPHPKAEPPLGLPVTWVHKFLFLNLFSTDFLLLEADTTVSIYTPCLRFRPFFFVLKSPTCPVLLLPFPLFKDWYFTPGWKELLHQHLDTSTESLFLLTAVICLVCPSFLLPLSLSAYISILLDTVKIVDL